jgi:muconate cycloisomerase
MKKFGVGAVKVKTGPTLEGNRALLTKCREILGPEVELRIDANSAWNGAETVAQLRELADFQLAGCEQPVPGDDYAGMATATAAKVTPIAADESLCSFADAERLIRERGCDIFNLRVSKCGGLLNAARLRDLATAAGLRCQLGAQVGETGILSAAGRHLATRSADLIWHEGSYGALLLEQDLTVPDITVGPGGWAPALDAPGLGVAPDPERLRAFTTETFTIPLS